MNTVQEIETAIQKLPLREIHEVGDWLQALREELWDRQIEADARAGRLDKMITRAKTDYHAGKATAFP
jgi:hypothetical protein